jgi:hypothetical protein
MIAVFLLLVSHAFADPIAKPMKKGDMAPFSGTLLNDEAVAKIIADTEASEKMCVSRIDLAVKEKESKMSRDNDILLGKIKSCEQSLENLDDEYVDLTKKYNRKTAIVPYAAAGGFVGGIVLTVLVTAAVSGVIQ